MNVLDYWRNSLADADRLNPDFSKMKNKAYQIDFGQLQQRGISKEITGKLFGKK